MAEAIGILDVQEGGVDFGEELPYADISDIEEAIIGSVLAACDDCEPHIHERANTLSHFVAIGRLSTSSAIGLVNEKPCVHLAPLVMPEA